MKPCSSVSVIVELKPNDVSTALLNNVIAIETTEYVTADATGMCGCAYPGIALDDTADMAAGGARARATAMCTHKAGDASGHAGPAVQRKTQGEGALMARARTPQRVSRASRLPRSGKGQRLLTHTGLT